MSENSEPLYPQYDMNIWLRTCDQELPEPLEGTLTGSLPAWLRGALLRNGPGCSEVGGCQYRHVFDGMALLHRFAIAEGRATYQCRFLRSRTFEKNMAAQRIAVTEFGTRAVPDPCRTIFDRVSAMFQFTPEKTDNASVSVYPFGDQLYAMTELPHLFRIDPESLKTLGSELLPRSLVVSHTAHPHVMDNGDVYNVGLNTGQDGLRHVVVKFSNDGSRNMFETAEIVGSTKPRWKLNPAYMHSFGITENYFVVVEQPLCISLVKMLRRHVTGEPFAATLVSYPDHETDIVLINRHSGEITRYSTEPLFFMHIVNCFEEGGRVAVDLCTYEDGKVLDALYVDAIKSMQSNPSYGAWSATRPRRVWLPLGAPPPPRPPRLRAALLADVGVEMPRINYDKCNGRPYRFFYGIGTDVRDKHAGAIIKVDTHTGQFLTWHEADAYPSEPVFVARPGAEEEDDGVVLSAVLWGADARRVALLVLAARSLLELGRVTFATPAPCPRDFHGWYWPEAGPTRTPAD